MFKFPAFMQINKINMNEWVDYSTILLQQLKSVEMYLINPLLVNEYINAHKRVLSLSP